MKTKPIATAIAALLLSACGGGGSGSPGLGGGSNSQGVTYNYVAPKPGQTQSYVYNTTDIANDSGTYKYTETITSVNADNSYIANWVPLQSTYPIGGNVSGSTTPETDTYNPNGEITRFAATGAASSNDCTYVYAAGGRPAQLSQGQSWNESYNYQCGQNSTVETITGTFVGVESVTVPAGTFNAYKFQYSGSYPIVDQTAPNATASFTMTIWLDADPASVRRVRQTRQTTYSGFTAPGGYEATNDMQLTAYQ